jgi:hypothetical protein
VPSLITITSSNHSPNGSNQPFDHAVSIRHSLYQWFRRPFCGGVLGHVAVQNFSPPVSKKDQDEEHLKLNVGTVKKSIRIIQSGIVQECLPPLRWPPRKAPKNTRDRSLRNDDSEHLRSPSIRVARGSEFAVAMSTMTLGIWAPMGCLPRPVVVGRELRVRTSGSARVATARPFLAAPHRAGISTHARPWTTFAWKRRSKAVSLGLARFR